MKITYLNASDGEGHVEIQLAALGGLTGGVKMMLPYLKCQKIAKSSSLSLLLLLSRFVLTVYLITSMFPFTEGWLHTQNIGPAAKAL